MTWHVTEDFLLCAQKKGYVLTMSIEVILLGVTTFATWFMGGGRFITLIIIPQSNKPRPYSKYHDVFPVDP